MLYYIILNHIIVYYIVLHNNLLYYIILYYIILYYTRSYYIVLYCTVLYYIYCIIHIYIICTHTYYDWIDGPIQFIDQPGRLHGLGPASHWHLVHIESLHQDSWFW